MNSDGSSTTQNLPEVRVFGSDKKKRAKLAYLSEQGLSLGLYDKFIF